ncbi:MBL fold metallo-hydrolase [Streptosporangium sp. NPDC006013]|uniref:MBL fold metallo-hydrolase n=1 Tax=Streptosporangium sp. NPDC006013 TaxID=3155596 RepID=UPI0033B6FA6C
MDELACLTNDLSDSGQTVVVGFSTHPHWDHLLWHPGLGEAPRYGTARCADTARDRLSNGIDARRLGIPDEVPLDLLGLITGLPADTARIPWDGPEVRIIEHQAHAPGHAALLIAERGVLVAGDMLSDVLIPMLDLNGTADPIEDHLAALRLLDGVAEDVDVAVPGHGSIGEADQVNARIDQDRAYLHSLRDDRALGDPRVGPSAKDGWEWWPACTNGNSSASPKEANATGRPASDRCATRRQDGGRRISRACRDRKRDWAALRPLLHPYLHWVQANGQVARGRIKVIGMLQAIGYVAPGVRRVARPPGLGSVRWIM